VSAPGFTSKHPASANHQVLVYLSLLETVKPYVMESLRMPALPALLLFSHTLDCSGDFSIIVCDCWLELKFLSAEHAQDQVLAAVRLRKLWRQLLMMKLTDTSAQVRDDERHRAEQNALEAKLSRGLVEFVHNTTVFSIKRLLPGDLKVLYVGAGRNMETLEANPLGEDFNPSPNLTKGGMRLSANVTHNCVKSDEKRPTAPLEEQFCCHICQAEFCCGPLVRMEHLGTCKGREEEALNAELTKVAEEKRQAEAGGPLARSFYCSKCDTDLRLTSSEILRHKRSCGIKAESKTLVSDYM